MLAGVDDSLRFDPELSDDLKIAVSEACNNVVMHAYDGRPGSMVVDLAIDRSGVQVAVRDHGRGLADPGGADDSTGVGRAVISALADQVDFISAPQGGTEVRMVFTRHGVAVGVPDDAPSLPHEPDWLENLSGDLVACLSPVELLRGVLGRIARSLAARARFSLDRFSDVYLVTDAVAAHARGAASGSAVGFAIVTANRRLELTVGPMRHGSGARLGLDDGSAGADPPERSALALLADGLSARSTGDAELLCVLLVDTRRENSP